MNSDAPLNRDALHAELDAAKPRRVILYCAMFVLSAALVCLFLWLVLIYKRTGGFSAEMVPAALLILPAFAARMVPSFKLHRLEERCKQIKAQLVTPPAEPEPAPLQPFGTTSELERLETRFASLRKTRLVFRVLMLVAVLFVVVWVNLLETIIGPMSGQPPVLPEQKERLFGFMAVAIAGFVAVLALGIPNLVLNIRIKRLREDLELRRKFPR